MQGIVKEFVTLPIDEIVPYENNPRINDEAVADVAESIKQCGELDPIEVDEDNIILSGHTRLKAYIQLGYDSVSVLRVTGLTEPQKRKYRLLANKTGEKASWDIKKLAIELADLDFEGFDFGFELYDGGFDENALNDLFADAPEKEKKAKMIKCPHCGEMFEA